MIGRVVQWIHGFDNICDMEMLQVQSVIIVFITLQNQSAPSQMTIYRSNHLPSIKYTWVCTYICV